MPADFRPPTSLLRGLRVCFLAGTLGQGGAERQLFYIASALKAAGAQVLVLTLTSGEIWESRLQSIGIPVKYVGDSASRLMRLSSVTKAARAFRPDFLQSQHFYTNSYSALAGKLCRAFTIGAVRGNGFSDLRDCGRFFGRISLQLPHKLAANSHAAMRNLVSLGCQREKLFHLPNVVDLAQFRLPESRNEDSVTILGIGRFTEEKRFDRFLRALALLQQLSKGSFKALLAGDGPLRSELQELACSLGLYPGTLEFCGNVSDVRSLYRKAHVLLLTSDHEGTPNVVMEAMASGLPVVATAVGDVPELVQHGTTGYVVGTADEYAAARHLAELVADPRKRESMGNRAREFIQAHYGLDSLPGHLAGLYFRNPS